MLSLVGIFLAIVYFLIAYINLRRIRYYLTTERIIEGRGARILKEIPLEHFSGKPLG